MAIFRYFSPSSLLHDAAFHMPFLFATARIFEYELRRLLCRHEVFICAVGDGFSTIIFDGFFDIAVIFFIATPADAMNDARSFSIFILILFAMLFSPYAVAPFSAGLILLSFTPLFFFSTDATDALFRYGFSFRADKYFHDDAEARRR